MTRIPFSPAFAKLTIGSLDESKLEVEAHYNPQELGIDKQLAWAERPRGEHVELTGAPKRGMTSVSSTAISAATRCRRRSTRSGRTTASWCGATAASDRFAA